MRYKRMLAFIAVFLFLVSGLALAADVTRVGLTKELSAGESVTLDFKGQQCEATLNRVSKTGIELTVCRKDQKVKTGTAAYIDTDDDYVFDIIISFSQVSEHEAKVRFKLTYEVITNFDDVPIIEQVSFEDPETQKIVNESKSTKELIRRLSEKAGLKTEEKEIEEKDYTEAENTPLNSPNWEEFKKELKATSQKITDIPYLTHIAAGLVILAVLITLIHFSSKKPLAERIANIFFEEGKSRKKKSKK